MVGKEGGPISEETGATRSTRVCPWLTRKAALGSSAVLFGGEATFSALGSSLQMVWQSESYDSTLHMI